uniref:dUTPase n=1 Tax=Pseudomonas phage RVTF4 TaxID=3236931 RepID=A0AB39CDA5_9VIRU
MTVLSDKQIKQRASDPERPMITPFYNRSVKEAKGEKIASFGVSSAGYDIRAAEEFMIFTPVKETLWERIKAFFTGKKKKSNRSTTRRWTNPSSRKCLVQRLSFLRVVSCWLVRWNTSTCHVTW